MTTNPMPTAWLILMNSRLSATSHPISLAFSSTSTPSNSEADRIAEQAVEQGKAKGKGDGRFVHRFRKRVPSRRKSLGMSVSSLICSDMVSVGGGGCSRLGRGLDGRGACVVRARWRLLKGLLAGFE